MKREEVLDIFNYRFAAKEFNGDKIPVEDMQMIAETCRLSPSSFGLEPWKFVVLENREIMESIAGVSWGIQRQMPTTSHVIIALTRKTCDMRYDSEYIKDLWLNVKGVDNETFEGVKSFMEGFQKENLDVDTTEEKVLEWSKRQAYIALGNMMTAAAMINIDSCAIEGFDKEKVEKILVDKGILDKEHFDLTYMVVFGYRAESPKRAKSRRKTEDIIEWVK